MYHYSKKKADYLVHPWIRLRCLDILIILFKAQLTLNEMQGAVHTNQTRS